MKRNTVFLAVLSALVLSAVTSCGGPRLKIYNWTYYTPDSVIEKFEEEYNVTVIYDEFASNEDMYAKLKAGGSGYDIVFPSADYVSIMIHQNMLEKIDKAKIPNLANIDPAVLQQAVVVDGQLVLRAHLPGDTRLEASDALRVNAFAARIRRRREVRPARAGNTVERVGRQGIEVEETG